MLDQRPLKTRTDAIAMITAVALLVGLIATPLPAEEESLPLNFDAVAVNMSNVGPRGQIRLQIRVNRWSSEEERAKLKEVMKAQAGRRDLASQLFGKESVGTIRESQSLAYDLRYSRVLDSEAGQMIVLATDRPIAFAEAWRSSRTLDYNVSLVILNLDDEGRGDGQILVGAEFRWDEANDQIIIEHFGSEPIRLTSVRMR